MSDNARPGFLVSKPYFKEIMNACGDIVDDVDWLIDSGAFTNYQKGIVTPVGDYIEWIKTLDITPWRYFQLDVIGDPVATMNNLETMLDAGLSPIPVFTRGASQQHLERMFEASDVVAIGGLVGTNSAKPYLKFVMESMVGKDRWNRIHLLGFTNHNWISHYRPYSCDSSTLASASRYGRMLVYLGNGVIRQYDGRSEWLVKSHSQDRRYVSHRCRIDLSLLQDPKDWRRPIQSHFVVTAFSLADYYTDISRLGVHCFPVDTNGGDALTYLKIALQCFR